MQIDYKIIGKRLAARRKQLGLKQSKVNELAGLSDKYLSNIETARSIPSIDVLMRLCNVLQTTPDNILLGAIQRTDPSDIEKILLEKLHRMNRTEQEFLCDFAEWLLSRK
ncbi:MAG: helix-turn-helix transcriptional regulator [Clostridia bacterium]|nr:helix-turn-helix transcriptional regulator [Clostridia bacterium]